MGSISDRSGCGTRNNEIRGSCCKNLGGNDCRLDESHAAAKLIVD